MLLSKIRIALTERKMRKYDIKLTKEDKSSAFESLHLVTVLLVLYDIAASAISYFAALWIQFDCRFARGSADL